LANHECADHKSARSHTPIVNGLMARIAERIEVSKRPLILIGLGADPSAAPAIRALGDRLQSPFLVTPKAKGILSEDHPRFAGIPPRGDPSQTDRLSRRALASPHDRGTPFHPAAQWDRDVRRRLAQARDGTVLAQL